MAAALRGGVHPGRACRRRCATADAGDGADYGNGNSELPRPCRLSLGEAYLLAGHLEEAQALAERALVLAREHQERGNEAYALRLRGEIAAHRATPDVE